MTRVFDAVEGLFWVRAVSKASRFDQSLDTGLQCSTRTLGCCSGIVPVASVQ